MSWPVVVCGAGDTRVGGVREETTCCCCCGWLPSVDSLNPIIDVGAVPLVVVALSLADGDGYGGEY